MSESFDALHARLSALPAFFVGGLPRSGTTWVQQLLNSHPEILCVGESRYMDDLIPALYTAMQGFAQRRAVEPWAPGARGPAPHHMGPVFRAAFASLAVANIGNKDPERLVTVGEKTPENVVKLERLWATFPKARFIHVIRDPRDGAISGFHRFRSKLPSELERARYLEVYTKDWNQRLREARRIADGKPYLEIRYEDLHADTENRAAELFRFLGASCDAALIKGAIENASFERLSGGRKPGEEDTSSHYRQGLVGGWRDVLSDAEVQIATRNAGPLMAEFGYLSDI